MEDNLQFLKDEKSNGLNVNDQMEDLQSKRFNHEIVVLKADNIALQEVRDRMAGELEQFKHQLYDANEAFSIALRSQKAQSEQQRADYEAELKRVHAEKDKPRCAERE
uniref:Uncharacterized protein n=1 Tax=Panagrolaimus sp. ES5 TaxID=591445 RepID=A0AC34GGL6_9BILA